MLEFPISPQVLHPFGVLHVMWALCMEAWLAISGGSHCGARAYVLLLEYAPSLQPPTGRCRSMSMTSSIRRRNVLSSLQSMRSEH